MKIGSPSEEKASKLTNNERSITLKVGKQANLEIRGTSATDSNSIRPDLALLEGDAFLRSIKLEVCEEKLSTFSLLQFNFNSLFYTLSNLYFAVNFLFASMMFQHYLFPLQVRHTVSVLIKESEKKDGDEEGITDIVVEISWPMKDHDGNYLLYLSEVSKLLSVFSLVPLPTFSLKI